MMQNPRVRRMAVPLNISRKRSNTGLIIGGVVIVILIVVGIGLYFFLTSDCYARDEIDGLKDQIIARQNKLSSDTNKSNKAKMNYNVA